jgi:phosphopantothenoylcysteine decarboxylase/phosphopantothenate--cysteine ligase
VNEVTETSAPRRARRLVLCATGGYECTTLPNFVLALLRHCADDVQVVMTPAAEKLVSRYAVEVASRHFVFVAMDDRAEGVFVPHIELTRGADAVLVYPATANILGKIANGIADELVAALIIAAETPVFFVPVTNEAMWRHPSTQRNVRRLMDDGYTVLPNIATVEVATREGLDASAAPFPFPTLLARLQASLAPGADLSRVKR